MTKNDGGPAYPQLSIEAGQRDGHGDLIDPITASKGGMTLRDAVAIAALQGMLSAGKDGKPRGELVEGKPLAQGYVINAFGIADAFIAERENGKS